MNDDDVFSRRWVLAEDELLRLLWRCHGGESPDVVLVELHAGHQDTTTHPRPRRGGRRPARSARSRIRRNRFPLAR